MTTVKVCKMCNVGKPFSDFYKKLNGKFGLTANCKPCSKEYNKQFKGYNLIAAQKYREKNREVIRKKLNERYHADPAKANAQSRKSRLKNYDKYLETYYAYREKNKERIKAKRKLRAQKNPEKCALSALKRRVDVKQRTPAWVNMDKIKEIYLERDRLNKEAGYIKYHVDHIVPLKSDIVSGLHTESNLRVVLASENLAKHNKFKENLLCL
jgi:hypothetical protein